MARSEVQNINIVSNNYSRYGTSIYQQLYSKSSFKKHRSTKNGSYLVPSYYYNNNTSTKTTTTTSTAITTSPSKSTLRRDLPNDNNRNSGIMADNESLLTIGSRKSKITRKYKSLISSGSKKLINRLYDHGSSDTFSIFSSKSHKERDIRNLNNDDFLHITFSESFATINDLPLEILSRIISYIDQDKNYKILIYCLYVSKRWYKATKIVLYNQPKFVSTYRVAQFVTSLRLHPENGNLVKVLDLSNLKNGLIFQEEEDSIGESNHNNNDNNSNNIEQNDNGVLPNETGRSNNNTNNNNSEPISGIAYAGWRDWRYRNDPLYSSPILNSYTVKRVVSRSSSIHSNSSIFTSLSNGSITSINTSSSTRNDLFSNNNTLHSISNRVRSNSSVSSITSSIMSTFQNASHLSLTSSNGNVLSSSPLINNKNEKFNREEGNNPNSNKNVTQQNKTITSHDLDNKWFKFKVMSKNKRRLRSLKKYSTNSTQRQNCSFKNKNNININSENIDSMRDDTVNGTNNSDMAGTLSQIRFAIEQPFKTNHPYTNKFLLKYASCRDLPLGYILHILNHCPNLVELDLSNLTICDDFRVVNKSKHHKRLTSLILPSVEESTVMTNSEENRLEVVYATDSSKNYGQNKVIVSRNVNGKFRRISRHGQRTLSTGDVNDSSSGNRPPSLISSNSVNSIFDEFTGKGPDYWLVKPVCNRSDYPLPIDSQTEEHSIGDSRRNNSRNSNDDVELYKLNPVEIFEIICTKLEQLTKVRMDGAIWCRQYMIKYFILSIFKRIIDYDINNNRKKYSIDMSKGNNVMNLSFLKAGMNRNFPWSCKGTFSDFVVLIILDELLKNDDLAIEDLFNIKYERLHKEKSFVTDSDIMEISNVFPINFGLDDENQDIINFRIVILKNKYQTSYNLKKVSNDYISLVINLCINENYNFVVSPTESGILPKKTPERIDRLTHGLVARIRYLRNNDLRRHVGENNYICETADAI